MLSHSFDITVVSLIFTGAALLATLALYARQSLIVGYILLGILLGPWGLNLVSNTESIEEVGHVGIIFLLFLLGLNLPPQRLMKLLGEVTLVTLVNGDRPDLVGGSDRQSLCLQWLRVPDHRNLYGFLQHHYRAKASSDLHPTPPENGATYYRYSVIAGPDGDHLNYWSCKD